MSTHSVAEAKNRFSELIDRALMGEDVVITRHGRAVVELKAIPEPPHPVSPTELNWLASVASAEFRPPRMPACS